jgi:F-type H+-transporting ATPase subunit epsilon
MADNEFTVQIITPDRVFYEGSVSMVEFNTREGEIGVYKDHIPLTSVLSPGIVTLHENGGLKEAAVHSGFAQILPDKVTMLVEIAEWPDEIDVERAKRAEKRARDRIARHDKNLDLVRAETALRKSLVRQNLAEYR